MEHIIYFMNEDDFAMRMMSECYKITLSRATQYENFEKIKPSLFSNQKTFRITKCVYGN